MHKHEIGEYLKPNAFQKTSLGVKLKGLILVQVTEYLKNNRCKVRCIVGATTATNYYPDYLRNSNKSVSQPSVINPGIEFTISRSSAAFLPAKENEVKEILNLKTARIKALTSNPKMSKKDTLTLLLTERN